MKNNRLVTAILAIALGILFIVKQAGVISITLTVLGVAVIVMSIIDFVNKETAKGILKAVAGACIIVFGWMFVSLALYLVSAVLLVYGLFQLFSYFKNKTDNKVKKTLGLIKPAATVVAGAMLLFNQGGTVSWVFIVTGVLLVIEGLLLLVDKD